MLLIHGRELSPSLARFFRTEAFPRNHRGFLELAAITAVEADLSPEQEEVYYTLALDGFEYHDAAEAALAVV